MRRLPQEELTVLWDSQDIADALGVKVRTVHEWHRLGKIITPERFFGRSPAWDREKVMAWAARTKRS